MPFLTNHTKVLSIWLLFSENHCQLLGTKSWMNESLISYFLICPAGGQPVGTQMMGRVCWIRGSGHLLPVTVMTSPVWAWPLCPAFGEACFDSHYNPVVLYRKYCYSNFKKTGMDSRSHNWQVKSQVLNTLARCWASDHCSSFCAQVLVWCAAWDVQWRGVFVTWHRIVAKFSWSLYREASFWAYNYSQALLIVKIDQVSLLGIAKSV